MFELRGARWDVVSWGSCSTSLCEPLLKSNLIALGAPTQERKAENAGTSDCFVNASQAFQGTTKCWTWFKVLDLVWLESSQNKSFRIENSKTSILLLPLPPTSEEDVRLLA